MATGRVADSYGGYRARLVELLRQNGIHDLAVLRAFAETPRHLFVPDAIRHQAYDDTALPIGAGQTISQPTTQARFLQSLQLTGTERTLEIGTGSGYQAALLSFLTAHVISVERVPALAEAAKAALRAAHIHDVSVVVGDGSIGWHPQAPYDVIVVAAASPTIPAPLVKQITDAGRLIIPVQRGDEQELVLVRKQGTEVLEQRLGDARFVPLIGRHGFDEEE